MATIRLAAGVGIVGQEIHAVDSHSGGKGYSREAGNNNTKTLQRSVSALAADADVMAGVCPDRSIPP